MKHPILRSRELEHFPEQQLRLLKAEGILRETTRATEVPRPQNLPPGPDLVVRSTTRGWIGVADDDDYVDSVRLEEADVRQYEISVGRLVDRMRCENGIDGSHAASHDGLVPLGQKAIDGLGTVDVFLSTPNEDEQQFLARCQRLQRSPASQKVVLLTPFGVSLSPEGRRIADSTGVILASLAPAAESGSLALDWPAIVGSPPDGLATEYPEDHHIFRRQGKTWLVVYGGRPTSVPHSVGMLHICYLLREPGRHVHALVLRQGVADRGKETAAGSAGEMLDQDALDEYRKRTDELRREIEQAEANNDIGRAGRLREEFDALVAEISRATGLGGRKRKATDDRERARQAVSAAIRRALKAIETEHKPLWHHLRNGIKLGEVLCYQPGKQVTWLT